MEPTKSAYHERRFGEKMTFYPQYYIISAMTSTNSSFIVTNADKISFLGTAALCLSAYVFLTAKKINRYILYSKRLPQLLKKIQDHASSISKLLNNFEETADEIHNEISRCAANLKSLRKKVPRTQRKKIDSLLTTLSMRSRDIGKESAREVYRTLLYIIEDIRNLQIDYQMET